MITEIVDFKVIANTPDEEVIKVVNLVERELHFKQSGFIETELAKGQDNNWFMIHHYRSLDELKDTASKMEERGFFGEFAKVVDMKTVKVSVLEHVKQWSKD